MRLLEKSQNPPPFSGATFRLVTTTISQRELRNQYADIMRRVEAGETFIITRNKKQVGTLLPWHSPRSISTRELKLALTEIIGDSYEDLRRDLDAIAGQDATPRG